MKVLHVGCGRRAGERFGLPDDAEILTLDADPWLGPDLVCTLGRDPIPLPDESVDVIIAIHVLEHIGRQGDTYEWFRFWEEAYRVLVPGGQVHLESPLWSSVWAWADPQHCRALSPPALLYFSQDSYRMVGSRVTPYRIACDFEPVGQFEFIKDSNEDIAAHEMASHFRGVLEARKPLQPWWEDE